MELTRLFRPPLLDGCIGNSAVTDTLKTNIINHTVFPKMIFAGPPGVGKSSTAMAMALALQCPNAKDGAPCLECETCKEILQTLFIDGESCCNIYLINMADKKTIADVREIMEILEYSKSSRYNYSILILEEPQNLSPEAQDLLNKPLEHLQEHLIIFFTTTELASIRDAIQSRCVVHTLTPPNAEETTELLQGICWEQYHKTVPKSILDLIVEYSDNIPRNAINNLELVINSGELSIEQVNSVLGKINYQLYIDLFSIIDKDIVKISEFIQSLRTRGVSYFDFVSNMYIFMTDAFKMKYQIPSNRYTKKQYTACRKLFEKYSYADFIRIQALTSNIALISSNNGYYNERFAESQLYQLALNINQNFDVKEGLKKNDNEHTEAVEVYRKRQEEERKTSRPVETVADVVQSLAEGQNLKMTVVRETEKIERDSDTNIVY